MGSKESNTFGTPYKFLVPQDEALNKPLPPHSTSMQAYHNSGSTPTPFLNPFAADSYFGHYMWPNQANSTTLNYGFLHDASRLSKNPAVVGDAATIFSEKVRRVFGKNNLDTIKKCDEHLQPKSSITQVSGENGDRSVTPKNNRDGESLSAASETKGSPDEYHDTNNDFPSTKKQQCYRRHGNADSTEQNQNWGTGLNASGSTAQLANLEEDEIRKERKRQSNRESAKRSRIRKQRECEELHRNMDILKDENSSLTRRLVTLSEECQELKNENDSLQEELVKMYGPESIVDLLPMKPA